MSPGSEDYDGMCIVTIDDCHTAWIGGFIDEGEEDVITDKV